MRLSIMATLVGLLLVGCIEPPPSTGSVDAGPSDAGADADLTVADIGSGEVGEGADVSVAPDATSDAHLVTDAADAAVLPTCEMLPAPHIHWSFDSLDGDGFVSAGAKTLTIAAEGADVDPQGKIGGALSKLRAETPWTPHHAAFELPMGTLTFWFRAQRIDIVNGLVSKDANGVGAGHLNVQLERAQLESSTTRLQARFQQDLDPDTVSLFTPETLRTGTWYFIAARWDGEWAELFLDGKSVAKLPLPRGIESNHEPLGVGFTTTESEPGLHTPVQNTSNARLDELIFWDEPLSNAQIRTMFNDECAFAP